MVCATSKGSDQPAHARSMIRAFASRLNMQLTEHHLEFLSLKEAAKARLSLHLSKCHIFGNHLSRLNNAVLLFMLRSTHMRRIYTRMYIRIYVNFDIVRDTHVCKFWVCNGTLF